MNMELKHRGKVHTIGEVKACSELKKITGLMFTSQKRAKPLLFNFSKPTRLAIHSFFVFYPFIAIWLDEQNNIIEMQNIRPFRTHIRPKKAFSKLLEVPNNKKYAETIRQLS